MPLRLITGSANSGKTGRVLEIVSQALGEGMKPIVLLPTRPDVERMRAEVASTTVAGVRCSRFEPYVSSLWTARGDGRHIVSRAQRLYLLDKISRAEGYGAGVVRVAERALRDLVGALGAEWTSHLASSSGNTLARLLLLYERELAQHRMLEMEEAAHTLVSLGKPPHNPLIFHRYDDLSRAQEGFIREASAHGGEVAVTLTWEEGRRATSAADPLVARLIEIGARHEVLPRGRYTPSVDLSRLERELFESPSVGEPDGSIVFSSGDGLEAEDTRICTEIRRLIGEGLNPERVAVAIKDAPKRAPSLVRMLADIGIQADLDARLGLSSVPIGRAFLALARFCAHGQREDLLVWLRSGYGVTDPRGARHLEERWLRQGRRDIPGLLDGLASLDGATRSLVSGLRGETGEAQTSPMQWLVLADHMMRTRWGGIPVSDGMLGDARAHAAIVAVIDDLRALGEPSLSPKEVLRALSASSVSPGEVERPGRVQVMEAERIRGRRFDVVVVAGLNEGQFPGSGNEAMQAPQLQQLLAASGVADRGASRLAEERTLFYGIATRARQTLVLSRRSATQDGHPLGASAFWEEVRDMYRDPKSEAAISCDTHPAPSQDARREPQGQPNRERVITDPTLLQELASRVAFSASELEAYSRCPFRWFTERGLRARPAEYELDPARLGSIAHAAMALAYPAILEEWGPEAVTACSPETLRVAALDSAQRAVAKARVPAQDVASATDWVKRRVLRTLRTEAGILPGFTPVMFETPFGMDGEEPVDFGTFSLVGRVDRVDAAPDGRMAVVDYKSGNIASYRRQDTRPLLRLQIPLYMAAISEREAGAVVAGLYRSMSDGATRGLYDLNGCPSDGLTSTDGDPDVGATVAWAVSEAARAAEGIRRGEIYTADSAEHCAYCSVTSICGGGARS